MMQFDGVRSLPLPQADLFAKLSDARFLLACVPDVESVSKSQAEEAVFKIRPGFSFVRGSLDITLKIIDTQSPTLVRYMVHGKGIGAGNDVEASMRLEPAGTGTDVHWSAEVKNLTGLLKMVPQGLIKASAQKVIVDMWDIIAQKAAG